MTLYSLAGFAPQADDFLRKQITVRLWLVALVTQVHAEFELQVYDS